MCNHSVLIADNIAHLAVARTLLQDKAVADVAAGVDWEPQAPNVNKDIQSISLSDLLVPIQSSGPLLTSVIETCKNGGGARAANLLRTT
jgi:hypothetical protein